MPSQFPCPDVIRGCDCTNDPVTNFSSEDPDQPVFISNFYQPPQNGTWFAPGCLSICESFVSQQAADECAQRQAITCSFDGAPTDGNPLPGGGSTAPRFGNNLESCDAECEGGAGTVTALVAPGTVISATQADADARAHALACKEADRIRVCFATMSPLPSVCQGTFTSVAITAFGGTPPYTFSHVGGTLPTGMSFSSSGILSGTPSGTGTFSFTIEVTDSIGTMVDRTFAMTVNDCSVPAPCPLFVEDNTSFGQLTLDTSVDPALCAEWSNLPVGAYKFVYISGAFESGADFYINIGGGELLKISSDSTATNFQNVRFPIGGGPTTDLAALQAYYLTTNDNPGFEFNPVGVIIGDEYKFLVGSLTDVRIGKMGARNAPALAPTGSSLIMEVIRYRKLVAPQPVTLQINSLATFASSRFVASFDGSDSAPIALDANALTVETALNLIPTIILAGGVTCAGTLDGAGMTVTFNLNGARSAIGASISTVSPGWIGKVTVVDAGSAGTPSVQTLLIDTICPTFQKDIPVTLPTWDGSIIHSRLKFLEGSPVNDVFWRTQDDPLPQADNMCGIVFERAHIRQRCNQTSPPAPAENYWELIIYCTDTNTSDEAEIWAGFKTGGLDPTGTYQAFPIFDIGGCESDSLGVQSITLDGTF